MAWPISWPDRAHQEIVGEIYRQLGNALSDSPCRPYVAPFDVRLPKPGRTDEQTDTVVQPDELVTRLPSPEGP